jgi:serine/threonine protein phosphatase PrpC
MFENTFNKFKDNNKYIDKNRIERSKNVSYNIINHHNYQNYPYGTKHQPAINLYDPIFKSRPKSEIIDKSIFTRSQSNHIKKYNFNNTLPFKTNSTRAYNKPNIKDNLVMTYKNYPITTPININNSIENRIAYSQSIQNRIRSVKEISKPLSVELNKENGIYNPSAKCVKEYSYKEDQNKECRATMEDLCVIMDKFMNDINRGLFCLYDGHGGIEPVKYVKDRIPDLLIKYLNDGNTVEKSLIFSFQKVDDELKVLSQSDNHGTTACIVYIYKEVDTILGCKNILYCANVGDTRCILLTDKQAKRISYDDKASDNSEAYRIRKAGGIIFNGRVFGQLALSRALGDHGMKKHGVISTPHVFRHIISEKDKYIVICSDGVWDVTTDEDVYNLSAACKNSDELSSMILKNAIKNGSRDNISCITIKVN